MASFSPSSQQAATGCHSSSSAKAPATSPKTHGRS